MKRIISLLSLIIFSLQSMDVPLANKKSETVGKMLAFVQPDYEKLYDQVSILNLCELEPYLLEPQPVQSGEVVILWKPPQKGSVYDREEEFKLLWKVATTRTYAPLIKVLFENSNNIPSNRIAQSMLLHAINTTQAENVNELLESNVNPNIESVYFFDKHAIPRLPLVVAVGSEANKSNPAIVEGLIAHGARFPQNHVALLLNAIETYCYGDEDQKRVIEILVQNGACPHRIGGEAKWVGLRQNGARGRGGIELVQNLMQKGHTKFAQLIPLFEKCHCLIG